MSIVVGTTSAQTPKNANFGGLKKFVAGYVQGANLAPVLGDAGAAINAAIDRINTRNWHWLNKQSTISLTAGTRTYTIPADFKRPRKLEQLDSSSNVKGEFRYQIPKEFLDTVWDDSVNGEPQYYTIRNAPDDRLLTFDVPPSSAFVSSWPTVRLTYFARMGHFAADGETLGDLEAPPEVRNFLVWYGRWELASMRGQASQIRAADEAWKQMWASLIMDDTNEQTDWATRSRFT